MNSKAPVALAIGVGYLLGRTHKFRLAVLLGTAAATGQIGGLSTKVLQQGQELLKSSPELGKLTESASKLFDAGRTAAISAMNTKAASMGTALEEKASQGIGDGGSRLKSKLTGRRGQQDGGQQDGGQSDGGQPDEQDQYEEGDEQGAYDERDEDDRDEQDTADDQYDEADRDVDDEADDESDDEDYDSDDLAQDQDDKYDDGGEGDGGQSADRDDRDRAGAGQGRPQAVRRTGR